MAFLALCVFTSHSRSCRPTLVNLISLSLGLVLYCRVQLQLYIYQKFVNTLRPYTSVEYTAYCANSREDIWNQRRNHHECEEYCTHRSWTCTIYFLCWSRPKLLTPKHEY